MINGSTNNDYYKESKDNTTTVVILAILLVLGMIIAGLYISPEPVDKKPRVGDVWEHYGTGDPFNKNEIYTRQVIAIKSGYVQFIENDRDTLSRIESVFKYNSTKISSKLKKRP